MLVRTMLVVAAAMVATGAYAQEDRGQVDGGRDEQGIQTPDTTGPNDAEATSEKNKALQEGTEPLTDEKILNKLHMTNQKEIRMGEMGQEKGKCQPVKDFGAALVADHTAAQAQVAAVAKQLGVELKDKKAKKMKKAEDGKGDKKGDPSENHDDKLEKHGEDMAALDAKTGEDFDGAYAKHMHEGHVRAVAWAEKAHAEASSEAVKELVAAMLPTLQAHEAKAAELHKAHASKEAAEENGGDADNGDRGGNASGGTAIGGGSAGGVEEQTQSGTDPDAGSSNTGSGDADNSDRGGAASGATSQGGGSAGGEQNSDQN